MSAVAPDEFHQSVQFLSRLFLILLRLFLLFRLQAHILARRHTPTRLLWSSLNPRIVSISSRVESARLLTFPASMRISLDSAVDLLSFRDKYHSKVLDNRTKGVYLDKVALDLRPGGWTKWSMKKQNEPGGATKSCRINRLKGSWYGLHDVTI